METKIKFKKNPFMKITLNEDTYGFTTIVHHMRFKMEGDNKENVELDKEKKSYAGIPEADFVVCIIYQCTCTSCIYIYIPI